MFDWKKEEYVLHNRTKDRKRLHEHDEHILRKIEDRVHLGLEIYNEAKKILNSY